MTLTCTNPDCPSLDIPITAPDDLPADLPLLCGACGGPLTEAAE